MHKYKILFVVGGRDPQRGGVQRVVENLSIELSKLGCSVYSLAASSDYYGTQYVNMWTFVTPNHISDGNRKQVTQLYDTNKFDFVVVENPQIQWYVDAVSQLKGKTHIIGHFHNSPFGLYSTIGITAGRRISDFLLVRKVTFCISILHHHVLFSKMRNIFDKMVLLSNNYTREMVMLSGIDRKKIVGISNPFPSNGYRLNYSSKKNTILFVGRLSNTQKRISSILRIWKKIQFRLPNWNIELVGGGPERDYWINQARIMDLQHITFYDFTNPTDYYIKAKMIVMTSLYEGFPMVIPEAMQYGCVPFAFNSFAALSDIVEDGISGCVIKAFDEDLFANRLAALANDENKLKSMSESCIEASKKFDSRDIASSWMQLFNEMSIPS